MNTPKRQYYTLVQSCRDIYQEQGNVSAFLRKSLGLEQNTPEIIEISYDMQAGSYVQQFQQNPQDQYAYCTEISGYLDKYLDTQDSLAEVGCGEATTTLGVFDRLKLKPVQVIGFDISFSRIKVAIDFWNREYRKLESQSQSTANFFVADLFHIPLADKSVDVVYTSHSIEPNGGREVEALESIFRIARKRVLLFEPCFEASSPEIQKRINSHGYIKGIPAAIQAAGGILRHVDKLENISNPLNPTYLFDIELPSDSRSMSNSISWADPVTMKPLDKQEDCFYCPTSGLVYPIIRGIPCLRPENGILATQLMNL